MFSNVAIRIAELQRRYGMTEQPFSDLNRISLTELTGSAHANIRKARKNSKKLAK